MQTGNQRRPTVGLALGSGSARGWAHLGVIRVLREQGVRPDFIAGTSVGAIVGAVHALDAAEAFEEWVRALTRRDIISYMDVGIAGGGVFEGKRLVRSFYRHFGDVRVEDLPVPFGAVATDLGTGGEVWLREGIVAEVVRASISLPGIFTPVRHRERWLVDGGLVNPVPISLCRAMGAEQVIAVTLNGDILGRHRRRPRVNGGEVPQADPNWVDRLTAGIREHAPWLKVPQLGGAEDAPGLLQVTASSLNIMQDRITRSRMAGDPPELLISPRLSHIGLLEFDRAAEAIEEGEASARRALPGLRDLLE